MIRKLFISSYFLCVLRITALDSERLNSPRPLLPGSTNAADAHSGHDSVLILDESETLAYIQDRRLTMLSEVDRLERRALSLLTDPQPEHDEDVKRYVQHSRRLQENNWGVSPADSLEHDPFEHDPFEHDPLQHDPLQHDPLQHEPLQYELPEHDPLDQTPLQHDTTSLNALTSDDEHEDPQIDGFTFRRFPGARGNNRAAALRSDEYYPSNGNNMYGGGYNKNYPYNTDAVYPRSKYAYGDNGGDYLNRPSFDNGYSNYRAREWPNTRDEWGDNSGNICCMECRQGDLGCLSNCQRICVKSQQCTRAGEGSYAAFCQSACPSSVVGLAFESQYLPIKACEGECAAQVQQLCSVHSCRDYGCYVRDCRAKAPLKCRVGY